MSENEAVLLDTRRTRVLVRYGVLVPLLLLLPITYSKGYPNLRISQLRLLLLNLQHSCSPPARATRPARRGYKNTYILTSLHTGCASFKKNSSRRHDSVGADTSHSEEQRSQLLRSNIRPSKKQVVSFFTTESLASPPAVFMNHTALLTSLTLLSDADLSPLLHNSRTQSHGCWLGADSNSVLPFIGASLKPFSATQQLCRSCENSKRSSSGQDATQCSLNRSPTHISCITSTGRKKNGDNYLNRQMTSRVLCKASQSNCTRQLCPIRLGSDYPLSNNGPEDPVTAGRLGASFIAATVPASRIGLKFLHFLSGRNLSQVSRCQSERTDQKPVPHKTTWMPDTGFTSQRSFLRSPRADWLRCRAVAKIADATSSQVGLRNSVVRGAETHKRSYHAAHTGCICSCWIPAASSYSRHLAKTSAALGKVGSSRAELLSSERRQQGITLLAENKEGRILETEDCNGGEGEEPYVKETPFTLGLLEKELQRCHRAVGLAIKSGDATIAFAEFDKHLAYAAATVRQWVRDHGSSNSTQLRQPLCNWKRGIVDQRSLPETGVLQRERGENEQPFRQEKGDTDEKQRGTNVHRPEDRQAWKQQIQLVTQRKQHRSERFCQRFYAVTSKLGGKERKCLQVDGGSELSFPAQEDRSKRLSQAFVFALMKPFIKSASGVLNLCCKGESGDEASQSMENLYIIARQVLRRLQEFQLLHPLSSELGNAFLSVAAAARDTEVVAATLLYMQQQGVQPQRKGYDAVLRTLLRQGEGYCRLRQSDLLRGMLDHRLPPTPEHLFALLLRDAARVRVQLDKEQQAAEKLKLCLCQRASQQTPEREHESLRTGSSCAHPIPPFVHTGHASELKGDKEKKVDCKKYVESRDSWSCCDTIAAKVYNKNANKSHLDTSSQENHDVHTPAIATAWAALTEEVRKSLHVLQEFVAGSEHALLLLQEVVSEQLPLLSDKAASRFVAALQTLQFPPIAHMSRVVVRHCADAYAAEASSDGHETRPKPTGETHASKQSHVTPPGAAGADRIGTAAMGCGNVVAREEEEYPIFPRDAVGDALRCLGDSTAIAPHSNEKVCKKPEIAQGQKLTNKTPSATDTERGFAQTHYCNGFRKNSFQRQQQSHDDPAADESMGPLPLQRAAVCVECGTRLRRVCLTPNERRLLRLGVLKLSAMLHPRQLRALLAFEAALSYEQLRPDVHSNVTRRHVSSGFVQGKQVARKEKYQQDLRLQQVKGVEREKCWSSTCDAVETSERSPKPCENHAVATSHPLQQAPSLSAPFTSAAAEATGGQGIGRRKASIISNSERKRALTSATHENTAGEWGAQNKVEPAQWEMSKENYVPAHQDTGMNQAVTSVTPRYTVVLDAANIAYNSQNRQEGVFSYLQIERVRQELLGRGERPLIILPSAYFWGFSKQRNRHADRKSRRTAQTFGADALPDEFMEADGIKYNKSGSAYQFLRNRLGGRCKRTITEVNLPPEANRLWLCRMGLCPLCIGEIQVPNRCKKSNKSSFLQPTSPKLPTETGTCQQDASANHKHNGAKQTFFQHQTVDIAPHGTVSGTEGGQRLSCLDRALLRLWEREECLFVCRSGAHDDHYHLLASLSACSPDSTTVSSTLLQSRCEGAFEGMKLSESLALARSEKPRSQPMNHVQQRYCLCASLQGSSQQQQQSDAVRGLQDGGGSVDDSYRGTLESDCQSAECLLNTILGAQVKQQSVCIDHWDSDKQEQLCRRTCSSDVGAPSCTCHGLWHQLWHCDRSCAGEASVAPSDSVHAFANPVAFGMNYVKDNRPGRHSGNQTATSFLGYSWDDFTPKREAVRREGVQRAHSTRSPVTFAKEAYYPVALLTNDRFRDHRLSTQQRLAFRHWRQLALLPYVFQRRLTLGKSGFTSGGISPTESTRHDAGSSLVKGNGRPLYGGSRHPQQPSHIGERQNRSTVDRRDHKPEAGGGSSEEVLGEVDAGATYWRLADDVEAVKPKTGTYDGKSAHAGAPRDDVSEEHEEGDTDDKALLSWVSRHFGSTESNGLNVEANTLDGRDGFKHMERRIDEWCLDDLDIQASPVMSREEDTTRWISEKTATYVGPERASRAKRDRNISERQRRCGNYVDEETEPLLFIGMLQPVTRRVQVSLKKNKRELRDGLPVAVLPTGHSKAVVPAAPKLPTTKGTQGDLRTLPRALEADSADGCSPGQTILSLLDLDHPSASHEDNALVWHIPLRRTEKVVQDIDDLFGIPPANATARTADSHISKRIPQHTRKQQDCLHDLLLGPSHDNLSASTRDYIPIAECGCSLPLVKTDTLTDRSLAKETLPKNVFADFDLLSQNTGRDTQSEEALNDSDVWLGVDLTPLHQILRAREQFLRCVE